VIVIRGVSIAAAVWGGQRGGQICRPIWGARISDDIIHDLVTGVI